jgi:hypothetical protein
MWALTLAVGWAGLNWIDGAGRQPAPTVWEGTVAVRSLSDSLAGISEAGTPGPGRLLAAREAANARLLPPRPPQKKSPKHKTRTAMVPGIYGGGGGGGDVCDGSPQAGASVYVQRPSLNMSFSFSFSFLSFPFLSFPFLSFSFHSPLFFGRFCGRNRVWLGEGGMHPQTETKVRFSKFSLQIGSVCFLTFVSNTVQINRVWLPFAPYASRSTRHILTLHVG